MAQPLCPVCMKPLPAKAGFCPTCGTKIDGADEPPQSNFTASTTPRPQPAPATTPKPAEASGPPSPFTPPPPAKDEIKTIQPAAEKTPPPPAGTDPPPPPPGSGDDETIMIPSGITALSTLFIVHSFWWLFLGISTGLPLLVLIFLALALLDVLVAWRIYSLKGCARKAATVVGAIGLLAIPIGTIISVIVFWYLQKKEIKDYFD